MRKKILEMFNLAGKTAIVTGGYGMLGMVYTSVLLEAGASVAVFDKKKVKDTEIKKKLKSCYGHSENELGRVKAIQCDITDAKDVDKAFASFTKDFKLLDILINNASLVKQVGKDSLENAYKPFLKKKPKDWEEYLKVDLTGAILMIQYAIPLMKKAGKGIIVNVSSTYGILSPDQRLYDCFTNKLSKKQQSRGLRIEKPIGYSISKAGVLNLTRYIATMFGKYNIKVNTLTPGGVFANNPPEFVKAYSKKTPLGRMANKEEYRGPLLFLVTEASSYMTGANLIVDGGWSAW